MLFRSIFIAAMILSVLLSVAAAAADPCSQYYGRGYCTDYIKERVGKKQSGDAKQWKANIPWYRVQPGDVAIFGNGKWGHVAYVEKVITEGSKGISGPSMPNLIEISEWNWGGPLNSCAVGPKFGVRGTRTISPKSAQGFWRP